MQSSGVGNCINMLSLINGCRFPFLTLVSMRGDFGEGNPWQYPMGLATIPVLEAMGVICLRVETPVQAVETVGAALTTAEALKMRRIKGFRDRPAFGAETHVCHQE